MRTHRSGRLKVTAALVAVTFGLGLTLTACGSSSSSSSSSGNTVTIWSSLDQPIQDGLEKALVAKLKTQNPKIKIKWERVDNINQVIITKIQAGNTPDIAFIPQPGVVQQMKQLNAIKPLDRIVDMSSLKTSMIPGSLEAGTVGGKLYGLLVSANVKGLVFYPKKQWAKAGYKVPTTLDELNALTDKIKADGRTPWCAGIESGSATGWPATDWFETLFMKMYGQDAYNQWVAHKIKFDSPQVKAVAGEVSKLFLTKGNTFGGSKAIASTNFATAGNPMFASSPKCWMFTEGSFITGAGFFPSTIVKNLDANVGVFGVPPATAGGANPVEGGGDLLTLLNDNPQTEQVVKDLSGTDIGSDAASTSSFISPHKDFNMSLYPNETTRDMAKVLYGGSTFLFDGSDAMPAQVGAGTFWSQITAWIQGGESLDAALRNIDQSWPTS